MSLPNTNPLVDESCEKLAVFLMDWLNNSYLTERIVQSYRCYDAYNVPYPEYPLLKVYRQVKQGFLNRNTKTTSQIVITYSLVLPELERLASIINWVSDQLIEALAAYLIDHQECSPLIKIPFQAEFRMMLNEVTQRVHPFLRITLSIEEF